MQWQNFKVFYLFFFQGLFICEREHTRAGREAEKEGEKLRQTLHWAWSPSVGAQSHDRKIVTCAEAKSPMRHPGFPKVF